MTDSRTIEKSFKNDYCNTLDPWIMRKGALAGLFCQSFVPTRCGASFVYGALSEIFNIAIKLGFRSLLPLEKYPIEMKVLLCLAAAPLSWMISYRTMCHVHVKRGHTLFRIPYKSAVGIGVASQVLIAGDQLIAEHLSLKDQKPKC